MWGKSCFGVLVLFLMWAFIPLASGKCDHLETCQRCISNLMCTFVKTRENELACVDKRELFQIQPKAAYKTPRRCNTLNKKKSMLKKEEDNEQTKPIKAEFKHSSNHEREMDDVVDVDMKASSTPPPLILQPSSTSTFTPLKTRQRMDGNINLHILTEGVTDHPTTQPESLITTNPPKLNQDTRPQLMKTGTLPPTKQLDTSLTDFVLVDSESSEKTGILGEKKVPIYPWTSNAEKYDLIKNEILSTCCKLEKLFREYGDLHFLSYGDIQNFHFVSFQIRNPVITRWYLCK